MQDTISGESRPALAAGQISALTAPGQEPQPLFAAAEEANVFIGANVYEFDPIWPGRFFNTTFLIGPDGELVTKYRRIHSSVTPSPHDFLDEYIAEVGWDAVFPVADTEIGRIGMFSCGEIRKPEVARQFAMKGAEVILHPTGDAGDLPGWEACKVARAYENNVYLISANAGGWITRDGFMESTNSGGTKIIDYRGNIIAEHKQAGDSMRWRALIDIEQLRAFRHSDNNFNEIAQLRTEMYLPGYSKTITPPNRFKDPMKDQAQVRRLYADTVERLTKEGIFPKPTYG